MKKRSNCTFMELKFVDDLVADFRYLCSNCTFMELKFITKRWQICIFVSFKLYLYGIEM